MECSLGEGSSLCVLAFFELKSPSQSPCICVPHAADTCVCLGLMQSLAHSPTLHLSLFPTLHPSSSPPSLCMQMSWGLASIYIFSTWTSLVIHWDFPCGGPMVKIPCFQCRGQGFDSQLGELRSTCLMAKKKKIHSHPCLLVTVRQVSAWRWLWTEKVQNVWPFEGRKKTWKTWVILLCWALVGNPVSLVTQLVKNLPAMRETWVWSLGWEDPLEKGMATLSSILAWRIPWTEEPDGLQSMGVAKSWIQLSNFHSLTPLFCPLPGSEPAAAGWIGTFNVSQKGLQTLEEQDGLPLLPLPSATTGSSWLSKGIETSLYLVFQR